MALERRACNYAFDLLSGQINHLEMLLVNFLRYAA
jgi:hypothetical protein